MTEKSGHGGCCCRGHSNGPSAQVRNLGIWAALRLVVEIVVNAVNE